MKSEPIEVHPPETFGERRRKRSVRLLAASFIAFGYAPQPVSNSSLNDRKLIVNEARFGIAPEYLRRPLLQDRKGKGTRKQRKAAKAKSKPPEPLSSPQVSNQVSWDIQDGVERKYYASVTGRLAPKSNPSNH